MDDGFIPKHGGYKRLLSYQKAEIVYDATVYFCNRFIDRRTRTHDQMVQAARSGKQNIIEASMASGTSNEAEIKLTGVARASLEELLADYRDFLRTRGQQEWSHGHPYAVRLRQLIEFHLPRINRLQKVLIPDPVIAANVIIGLIRVTGYLLDRQLRSREKAFMQEGGLRERMARARRRQRGNGRGTKETHDESDLSDFLSWESLACLPSLLPCGAPPQQLPYHFPIDVRQPEIATLKAPG